MKELGGHRGWVIFVSGILDLVSSLTMGMKSACGEKLHVRKNTEGTQLWTAIAFFSH